MLFPEFKSIVIFDTHQLIVRATSFNLPLVDGTLQLIDTCLSKIKTYDNVYCCFDSPTSYRKNIYSGYKHNRGTHYVTNEFSMLINRLLDRKYTICLEDGYEADDLIAKLCPLDPIALKIIVSNDEDLYQLLDNNTTLFRYCNSKYEYYNYDNFIVEYGILPSQWIDVKSICGCSSDNIKGIQGIGLKKVLNYLKNGDEILQSKINIENDLIKLNKKLVTLPYVD